MSLKDSRITLTMVARVVVVVAMFQAVTGISNLCTVGNNCLLPEAPIFHFHTFQIPQLVLLTIEGSMSPALSQRLFNANRRNPDDCPISITTFLESDGLDILAAYAEIQRGMEASILGDIDVTNITEKMAYNRILEVKTDMISRIPHLQKVLGWRSRDSDQAGTSLFNALSYIGFTYDSTLLVNRPRDESSFQWPFRMTKGWTLPPCDENGRCQDGNFPNLWQFPMTSLYSASHGRTCHTLPNCTKLWSSDDVRDLLLSNLKLLYLGNRAPFVLKIPVSWLQSDPKNVDGLDAFVRQLSLFNDIYIVSIENTIKWLFNPTPVKQLFQFKAWQCPLRASSINKPFKKYPKRPDPNPSIEEEVEVKVQQRRLLLNWESKSRKEKLDILYATRDDGTQNKTSALWLLCLTLLYVHDYLFFI